MEENNKYEIGIVDTRKVVQAISDLFGMDLKDYALTSLKRRLEHTIGAFGLNDADGLIARLKKDPGFFGDFMQEFSVETTELFRDPSVWRMLRDIIIPEVIQSTGSSRIFVPMISSGEELYSLAILLRESGFDVASQVYASSLSAKSIEQVKTGLFNPVKLENSESNYLKFSGKVEFSKYYASNNVTGNWDPSLIEKVQFIEQNTSFENSPRSVRLVLFRNKLIYFNQPLADTVISSLHQSLLPGGYLVVGTKENIPTGITGAAFQIVDKNEKIYRKK